MHLQRIKYGIVKSQLKLSPSGPRNSKVSKMKSPKSCVKRKKKNRYHLILNQGSFANFAVQFRQAEMELKKGQNMIEHEAEIFSRPARTWFQSEKEKAKAGGKVLWKSAVLSVLLHTPSCEQATV